MREDDLNNRAHVLAPGMAHEAFHRIQPRVLPMPGDAGNALLDTREGRYLMQLEWRAPDAALDVVTSATAD